MIRWVDDEEFASAISAEHALVDGFELVAFHLPAHGDDGEIIGFEVYGPDLLTLVQKGGSPTFDQAKRDAEKAFGQAREAIDRLRSGPRRRARWRASRGRPGLYPRYDRSVSRSYGGRFPLAWAGGWRPLS